MTNSPALLPQYFAAFCATLGAMGVGTILGFSSPAGVILMKYNGNNDTESDLYLTKAQNSWVSSVANLGALIGCPFAGFCIDFLGRRGTILYSVFPVTIGWAFIFMAKNYIMILVGRLITGLYCSMISLAVPTYISEFSSPRIRGTLVGGYQLMVFVGILFVYCLGVPYNDFRLIAIVCSSFPIITSCFVFFCKESPFHLLAIGNRKAAEKALKSFRGENYKDISNELQSIEYSVEESQRVKANLSDLRKPYVFKPFMMSLGLMLFQQFSGINAVLFNLASIFEESGSTLSSDISSIIIGVTQVLGTLVGSLLVDKVGRKLLLILSVVLMILSLASLGLFFYFLKYSPTLADKITWLPLLSLVVYVIAYSAGCGPIPWVMMGELFSPEVKKLATSSVALSNWGSAFVTTLVFKPLQGLIEEFGVYWMFSCVCVFNLIFCIAYVYETAGKSLQEINSYFFNSLSSLDSVESAESAESVISVESEESVESVESSVHVESGV